MVQKKIHEIEKLLNKLPSEWCFFLIYGPDRGLVLEQANKLSKCFKISPKDPFSCIKFEASLLEKDIGMLFDEIKTIPLFGKSRLIWIKNTSAQKKIIEAFTSILTLPLENLKFIIEAADLKTNSVLRNLFEKSQNGVGIPCYNDDFRALDTLIDFYLNENQLTIDEPARDYLKRHLGRDRSISRSELEKICLYMGREKSITLENLYQITSDSGQISSDNVIESILIGDLVQFELHFQRYLSSGATISWLLMSVEHQFQQLYKLKLQITTENISVEKAFSKCSPSLYYKKRPMVKNALAIWGLNRLVYIQQRIQSLILESRKKDFLAINVVRQAFISLTLEVNRLQKKPREQESSFR